MRYQIPTKQTEIRIRQDTSVDPMSLLPTQGKPGILHQEWKVSTTLHRELWKDSLGCIIVIFIHLEMPYNIWQKDTVEVERCVSMYLIFKVKFRNL